MSTRTEYAPGTPSWADNASSDPSAAASFYSQLFGWQTENSMPAESPGEYHMARLDGKNVAALGSQPMEGMPAVWNTYITVGSADEVAKAVADAGGKVMMEPFDVLDAGRMAVCADPAGAVFMVWEAKDSIGAEVVNEPVTLAWNELYTRDVDGCQAFYGSVFGWTTTEIDSGGTPYTLWHLNGGEAPLGGMLAMSEEMFPAEVPPHWLVYFAVDETDAVAARCEELGGTVTAPPFDTGVGRIAVLSDLQGAGFAVIALNEETRAQAP